jgi:hypothetical protein
VYVNTAPAPEVLATEQRLGMMRDGIINYSGTLVSGLLGVVLVPIVLAAVGAEAYGFWIAVLAVAAAIGTFDFGLGYAVTRAVAASSVSEDHRTTAFVRSAGNIYVLIGVLGGILTAIFVGDPVGNLAEFIAETLRRLGRPASAPFRFSKQATFQQCSSLYSQVLPQLRSSADRGLCALESQ